MPRFLGLVELSILRHVAYAYGVLPSVCSLCEGRSANIPRSFCICLILVIKCHMPLAICFVAQGVLPCSCSLCRGGMS